MSVQQEIETKLQGQLEPNYLDIVNESHRHNVPPGSESHFKITIVCEAFVGVKPVQRHQRIYGLLKQELADGIHALALHTYSPQEWTEAGHAPESPPCLGGERREG